MRKNSLAHPDGQDLDCGWFYDPKPPRDGSLSDGQRCGVCECCRLLFVARAWTDGRSESARAEYKRLYSVWLQRVREAMT